MRSMLVRDFDFELPAELIAQYPLAQRSASRLLYLNGVTGKLQDRNFFDLRDYLRPGDLLVLNNTRVMKARLKARKETGGRVEILVERVLSDTQVLAQVSANRAFKAGNVIMIAENIPVQLVARQGEFWTLKFESDQNVFKLLELHGETPLPPYISRNLTDADDDRYQTVYAQQLGAVAAPTAGLHFDDATIENLGKGGIKFAYVTLHVGAGTFQPVRVEDTSKHRMHNEWYDVPEETVRAIRDTKLGGGRVVAVGTTSLRALESAAQRDNLVAGSRETNLFITPGFQFNVVESLLTNFHLPRSTLLMLVAAFAGIDNIRHAYRHAIEQRYRFFSYGDAMLIDRAN